MTRRRWIITALTAAALLGAAAGTLALTAPAIAATACPQCYGLSSQGRGLYTERDDAAYRPMIDAATGRIGEFYGGVTVSPRVLICATDACYRRIGGGGEKGRALGRWAMLLSPAGANRTIATHELSHLEFNERLGPARGEIPRWFEEGLAVVVAQDARYLQPDGGCRLPPAEAKPVTGADWAAEPGDRGYLRAACVVSTWMAEHGGTPAVLGLVEGLRAGGSFGDLVTVS
ncbi:hypothetical protein [Actinoplanes sp. GCM10030250]|uniref:hypothetical protein n=1 Tax=Actinoplanes sp. GCM10030250 TaxID=3273376 RepID=UPI0036073EA7